ncbi:MAG: nucleotidyltransferase family protein [Sumerlaeia bacterium]
MFCLARPPEMLSGELEERVRRLTAAEGFDWEAFVHLCRSHGLAGLAHRHFQARPALFPSTQIAKALRQWAEHTARRNLVQVHVLGEVVKLLKTHGIAAVPYKGMLLSHVLYGGLSERYSADIDLLVLPEAFEEAVRVLASEGGFAIAPSQSDTRFHRSLVCSRTKAHLELHHSFGSEAYDFPLDRDWIAQALEIRLQGWKFLFLKPEHTIIALCAHGFKHGWARLGWLCDVGLMTCKFPIDWDLLAQEARSKGLLRICQISLRLLRDVLGYDVPDAMTDRVECRRLDRWYARAIRRYLLGNAPPLPEWICYGPSSLLRDQTTKRMELARYAMARAHPSEKDRATFPLPRIFAPLLYLWRPIRLVRTYGGELLKTYRRGL